MTDPIVRFVRRSGPLHDRRTFLKSLLSAGGLLWAGKAFSAELLGELEALAEADLFSIDPSLPPLSRFPQGIASGDPHPGGAVLWCRVAAAPGDEKKKVRLAYEIAGEPSFAFPLVRGVAATDGGRDHTVKVRVDAPSRLRPFQTYYYRFIYERCASRPGRFKTLPLPDDEVARIRFGFISCQDYTNG